MECRRAVREIYVARYGKQCTRTRCGYPQTSPVGDDEVGRRVLVFKLEAVGRRGRRGAFGEERFPGIGVGRSVKRQNGAVRSLVAARLYLHHPEARRLTGDVEVGLRARTLYVDTVLIECGIVAVKGGQAPGSGRTIVRVHDEPRAIIVRVRDVDETSYRYRVGIETVSRNAELVVAAVIKVKRKHRGCRGEYIGAGERIVVSEESRRGDYDVRSAVEGHPVDSACILQSGRRTSVPAHAAGDGVVEDIIADEGVVVGEQGGRCGSGKRREITGIIRPLGDVRRSETRNRQS